MKKGLSLLALAISQCHASDAAILFARNAFYSPRLNLSADYQNKEHSFGYFDGFLPFSGNNDNIWFADVRFLNRNAGRSQGNVGLGHRHQLANRPWIVGAYGFFDRRLSFDNNYFSALTLGGELKAVNWNLGANFYAPVGKTVKADVHAQNAQLMPSATPGIYNIYYNAGKEAALMGADIEAGHEVPHIPGLTAYVGAYGYPAAHGVANRVGPLVRAEYNLSDSGLLGEHPLMDSTVIEGFMRHDSFAGTNYYVGLKLSLNLDGTPRYKMNPLQRHMVDPVWKDLDVITATDAKKTPFVATNANGSPVTVAVANDHEQLQNYVDNNINVVGVNGTIDMSLGSVFLQENQAITGGVYDFLPGRVVPVALNGTLANVTGSALHLSINNTIEHLRIISSSIEPSVLTDFDISVGNFRFLSNTLQNGGLLIRVGDGSKDSVLDISNNYFSTKLSEEFAPFLQPTVIHIVLFSNSAVKITHLDNNRITMSLNSRSYRNDISGISVSLGGELENDTSNVIINSVQNNSVKIDFQWDSNLPDFPTYQIRGMHFYSGTFDSAAFIPSSGTLAIEKLYNNQFDINFNIKTPQKNIGEGQVTALDINGKIVSISDVAFNRINLTTNALAMSGINFESSGTMNVNRVHDNQVTLSAISNPELLIWEAYGINMGATSRSPGIESPYAYNAHINLNDINNNTIIQPVVSESYGMSYLMPQGEGFLNITNILDNRIIFVPFETGRFGEQVHGGLDVEGIFIGGSDCDHSPNLNAINVQHINRNQIEMRAISKRTPHLDYPNVFYGIDVGTSSAENKNLDQVRTNINDISNNTINIQVSGVLDKARGINAGLSGDSATTVSSTINRVVNNQITINTPQSLDTRGIQFVQQAGGPMQVSNVSSNNITANSNGFLAGLSLRNAGVHPTTVDNLNNNIVSLTGHGSKIYGLYFAAEGTNKSTLPGTFILGNQLNVGTTGTGIYAFTEKPGSSVTLVADPNHPNISLSAANNGASYGKGHD